MPARFTLSLFLASATLFGTIVAVAQDSHQLPANHLSKAHPRFIAVAPHGHSNPGDASGTPGVDSLSNWNGFYKTPRYDPSRKPRNAWFYNLAGNRPLPASTTTHNAPILPTTLPL